MFGGFIEGLPVAFILALFNVNDMLIEVWQPYSKINLTDSHYYLFFGILGIISKWLIK